MMIANAANPFMCLMRVSRSASELSAAARWGRRLALNVVYGVDERRTRLAPSAASVVVSVLTNVVVLSARNVNSPLTCHGSAFANCSLSTW